MRFMQEFNLSRNTLQTSFANFKLCLKVKKYLYKICFFLKQLIIAFRPFSITHNKHNYVIIVQ